MIQIRPANARGRSRLDWLDSRHTFFLQIWLVPNKTGVSPAYDQRQFPAEERHGRVRLLVTPDGRNASVATHQEALIYGSLLDAGETATLSIAPTRTGYVHLARGKLNLNGQQMEAGDGAALIDGSEIRLSGIEHADVLLFDLPHQHTDTRL